MDQDFYNDEFDSFLKQKADEYFMYPTESVWNKVKKNLFWRNNWLSVAGSVLVLCLLFFIPESFFSGIFISHPATDKPMNEGSADASSPSHHKVNHLKSIRGRLSDSVHIASASIPATTGEQYTLPSVTPQFGLSLSGLPSSIVSPSVILPFIGIPSVISPFATLQTSELLTTALPTSHTEIQNLVNSHPVRSSASLFTHREEHNIDIASHFTVSRPVVKSDEVQKTIETEAEEAPRPDEGIANFLQDMAVIKLSPKKQGRFNLQFYFSPLVSYRTLTDNNDKSHGSQVNTPRTMNPININQYVDHQPSIGVELGSNILFRATKRLTIKTGMQMNYSRYTIKAYRAGYQKASIALNSTGPVGDTITSYTTIRNFDGYLQEQLQNQYLQISVPVGVEFKLLGSKRLQLNIAGTLQPTLLLFNDTYLLSTDYMNYTKEPSLVRKWNLHSSAEAYISYQFANVRWQVGPQFRYQLLSSYNDRYPIHEYLMEYGIKFGISKTLR